MVRSYPVVPGVALTGIDSVQLPIGPRHDLWARLGDSLRPPHLDAVTTEVDVKNVVGVLDQVRAGGLHGPGRRTGRGWLLSRK